MTHPRITIVTVVYNGAATLEATIRSVLVLNREEVDYIVIDGGSTDGTLAVIDRYRHLVRQAISEPDRGIYDAMNKGWALADADSVVLFLGSGDRILSLPDRIDPDAITYGKVQMGDCGEVFEASHGDILKVSNRLHHQALLIPKRFSPQPPFDLRYPTYADFDFNQRLYQAGHRFVYDDRLRGYALPGGASARLNIVEMARVVFGNFGPVSALISVMHGLIQLYVQARQPKVAA
ncbi:MAG: glycosyltransferase [Methylococcaceae bacterium]|nr:glycosyltransferase [Methylococcaceae bacterium]